MKPLNTLRAVLYLRVSTDKQAEEGTSLAVQEAMCLQKAQQIGAQVIAIFRDEGISGALYASRPGVQAALATIDAGNADTLIVANLSRFSRDAEHQAAMKKRVELAGGRIVFCDINFDQTPEGNLAFGIMGNFAQYERHVLRNRTAAGRKKRAEEGQQPYRSQSPFGFHVPTVQDVLMGRYEVSLIGTYQMLEDEAAFVREIFKRCANGDSLRGIATWLNSEAVPTRQKGRLWRASTIHIILKNPLYKGTALVGKVERIIDESRIERGCKTLHELRRRADSDCIAIPVPALVGEELWTICQQRLADNKARSGGRPDRRYLLSSLMRCPTCHRRMSVSRNMAHKIYYRCSKDHDCSNRTCHRGEELEQAVTQAIITVAQRPELLHTALSAYKANKSTPSLSDEGSIRAEFDALNKQEIATARAQVDALMQGRSTDVYDHLLSELSEKRMILQSRLDKIQKQNQQATAIDPRNVADTYSQAISDVIESLTSTELTPAEKNKALLCIIQNITPEEDKFCIKLSALPGTGLTVHHVEPSTSRANPAGFF